MSEIGRLEIISPDFADGGKIPRKNTGRGEDLSPQFELLNMSEKTVSTAIILDDLDIPFIPAYAHWVIWNLPPTRHIPGGIPHGEKVTKLGATQGVGYGKNCYRGPLPPFFIRIPHRYRFSLYTLDTTLSLDGKCGKKELLRAIEGHVLQYGTISGSFSNLDIGK